MRWTWPIAGPQDACWRDWRWQHAHRLTERGDVLAYFPRLSTEDQERFRAHAGSYRLAVTPYVLSLVEVDTQGNPRTDDPIWRQFSFLPSEERVVPGQGGGDSNWEVPGELPTPILHHKYPGRAILRVAPACLGHCNYCYLPARVLEHRRGPVVTDGAWRASLDYLAANPSIHDVLLSGGDPLLLGTDTLDRMLGDLAGIPSIRSTRVNTRALTFNPFRVDADLCKVLRRHRVTAVEIHVAHPRELTSDFDDRLAMLDQHGHRPLVLWRAPLLRGVNDDVEVLRELLTGLYRRRVTPYYLFHDAPRSRGRALHGTSIRRGVEILSRLRREVPGPAFPRYVLFHPSGKQDIPLEPDGTPEFQYQRDAEGNPEVRFRSWRGEWVTYPDVADGHA